MTRRMHVTPTPKNAELVLALTEMVNHHGLDESEHLVTHPSDAMETLRCCI
jgi:hypothetical protein